jgi:hypothetical protein
LRDYYHKSLVIGSSKGRTVFLWCGAPGGSDSPNDAVPHADRERWGFLIQEVLALLRDESFELDLIGYASELERLFSG